LRKNSLKEEEPSGWSCQKAIIINPNYLFALIILFQVISYCCLFICYSFAAVAHLLPGNRAILFTFDRTGQNGRGSTCRGINTHIILLSSPASVTWRGSIQFLMCFIVRYVVLRVLSLQRCPLRLVGNILGLDNSKKPSTFPKSPIPN
jgi:hypothetical protein